MNSTGRLIPDEKTGNLKKSGNPTECALLIAAKELGFNYEDYRIKENYELIVPFDSKRKCMTSVIKLKDPNHFRVYVKGAPDILLASCTSGQKDDKIIKFEAADRNEVKARTLGLFSDKGYRSILLAYKDIDAARFDKNMEESKLFEFLRSELTLIAVIGIQDPLREEVKAAVRKCHDAGVTVRMVTGDEIIYAKTIAVEAGIINEADKNRNDYTCMEGNKFCEEIGGLIEEPGKPPRVRNQEKFDQIASQLRVMARSKPEHKYMLVIGLKNSPNNVVAVTGDGTNDALALKKSDVGFAMGICGTEVAKEAAHIILLDDNFASIVTAIKWGRNIYLSVRKFLQFQMTVNIVALFLVFVSGLIIGESPLTSVQMLWVNLIMDTFAALALATEPPSEKLLEQRPYSKNDLILTAGMSRNIISQALLQITILVILLFFGPGLLGVKQKNIEEDWNAENGLHYTIIFNTFVFLQVFNEINSRKISGN